MSEPLSELDVANAATAVADPGAGADPTPADGAAPAVETAVPTPEPAAIDWNDLNLLNQAAERIAAMGYTIAPAQTEAPQAEPEWNPYDPSLVDQRFQSQLAPIAQQLEQIQATLQAQQQAETNELIDNRIELAITAAELAPAEGQNAEQLHAAVLSIANGFAAQKLATYGQPRTQAEAQQRGDEAIQEAVGFLNALRAGGKAQGVEEYKQDLTRDGSHLLEPPVRSAGVEGATPAVSELDVARRFIDSRR